MKKEEFSKNQDNVTEKGHLYTLEELGLTVRVTTITSRGGGSASSYYRRYL